MRKLVFLLAILLLLPLPGDICEKDTAPLLTVSIEVPELVVSPESAVSSEADSDTQATELRNPSFQEVRDFILRDTTSHNSFVLYEYECRHFTTAVNNNAEAEGLRCAFVLYNSEQEKVRKELKKKHIVLKYGCVHGSPTEVGLGVSRYGVQTTLEEYASFTKEWGTPALLVQSGSCGAIVIREGNLRYCCWPQIFMESGVWAYYILGGGADQVARMEKAFSNEKTIGLAIRKNIVGQNPIFGDILAHTN